MSVEVSLVGNRYRVVKQGRIIFTDDQSGLQRQQRFEEPVIVPIHVDREHAERLLRVMPRDDVVHVFAEKILVQNNNPLGKKRLCPSHFLRVAIDQEATPAGGDQLCAIEFVRVKPEFTEGVRCLNPLQQLFDQCLLIALGRRDHGSDAPVNRTKKIAHANECT
jgi:hypothetical protein